MKETHRNCDNCDFVYKIDYRNFNRGWGRCCSKVCAAIKREDEKKESNFFSTETLRKKYEEENKPIHFSEL
tara:strand:- start:539 stop:751 length:213 start_codon:yes stop_codon:yes gene_type:complete